MIILNRQKILNQTTIHGNYFGPATPRAAIKNLDHYLSQFNCIFCTKIKPISQALILLGPQPQVRIDFLVSVGLLNYPRSKK
jgi:hypothetical protein